jgi:acyl-homoserine-lactone acylase
MLKRLGLGLLALLVIAAVGLVVWEPLAAGDGGAAPPARTYDVTISRDEWGVPHIHGKTDADVGYGIGYAQSEDDFATVQEILAATRGRAGAMLGEDGAKVDYAAALLDARGAARAGWPKFAPETRALVEAYAAGLNRYAEKHPEDVRLKGLFPATAEDVVAGFALRSPFFFGLDKVIGALSEGKDPPRTHPDVGDKGSNAFAIAPSRSEDGATRLVVNSHQPWEGGVTWYELGVRSDAGWRFHDALFPGAPYPLLGHNENLGWANTVNRPDLIDTYRLRMNADGSAYAFDGKWLPLEEKRVWLRVKMGPFVLPVPRTVLRSVHGPAIRNDKGVFAFRYSAIGEVQNVETYYRLNKAQDFASWRAVLAGQGVAATNFVYADRAGNIALFYNAKLPKRAKGYDWPGILPGDTSKTLWTSYEPFDVAPALVNPASGYVANANNTPYRATAPANELDRTKFAPELGIELGMTNRAHRMLELFDADTSISRNELHVIKMDKAFSKAGWVGDWMPMLLAVKDPKFAEAQALLRTWDWTLDGKGKADALAALAVGRGARAAYNQQKFDDPAEALADVTAFLMKHYERLDPPLGDALRLQRGTVDLPLSGGPDLLRAIYWKRDDKTGALVGENGDGYIMNVEWLKDGTLRSESIHQFGSASTRPESPHYADQAKLFATERYKPVRFTDAEIARHTKRTYRP